MLLTVMDSNTGIITTEFFGQARQGNDVELG